LIDRKIKGFLIFIIFFGVFGLALVEINPVQAIPSSNYIPVTYLSQETSYYCGPAVVQMALNYVGVALPSQDQLATEMQTDPVEGATYIDMMRIPFENRGFTEVYESTLELDDLKNNNYNGYLTIILIYFSVTHEYQHYILVIGYNASGVFVHDPWPVTWPQPLNRTTGADIFISNELLANLWACDPPYWGLVIPYLKDSGVPQVLWQQHWYILLIVPVAIAGIVAAVYIKRRKTHDEKFKYGNGSFMELDALR